jgi:small-conductance mechanosensitive channel
MTARHWITIAGLLTLVALGIAGLLSTRDTGQSVVVQRTRAGGNSLKTPPLVDERPLHTARSLAALAATPEEQQLVHQALKVADHEIDLAFADALRRATEQPVQLTPEIKQLLARVSKAEAAVESDLNLTAQLTKQLEAANDQQKNNRQDQLDVAKAQLELDQDELDDAKDDLDRSGHDPRARIEHLKEQHEAGHAEQATTPQPTKVSDLNYQASTLLAQLRAWNALRGKQAQLERTRQEALDKIQSLGAQRDAFKQQVQQEQSEREAVQQQAAGFVQGASAANPTASKQTARATVSSLKRFAEDQRYLADLGRRIQDEQELAGLYANWTTLVGTYERRAVHGMIASTMWIVLVLLAVYVLGRIVDRFFTDLRPEHSRLRSLRVVIHFVVQALGASLILFVLFGAPSQTPTILGLAGAGLTVALKDFIVAFFGWFVLMGRNGIRVGDWVEINGVVGEVVEISLLHTVLLETGNWTDTGHPTGRKVAFMNSFAIEGHFFNFSTSGQWLWDELEIMVPSNQNPYPIIDAIQRMVTKETEANARIAEQEWKGATNRYRVQSVSATPAINLRPTPSGVEVHVRYITRANERYAARTGLYQALVELLHQRPADVGKEESLPAMR